MFVNDGVVDIQAGRSPPRASSRRRTARCASTSAARRNACSGALTATAFLYSGRLEATLSTGYVPPAGTRFNVITATLSSRSGLFHSTATPGLTLDESQTTTIGLVGAATPTVSAPDLRPSPASVAAAPLDAASRSARAAAASERAHTLAIMQARRS